MTWITCDGWGRTSHETVGPLTGIDVTTMESGAIYRRTIRMCPSCLAAYLLEVLPEADDKTDEADA